MLDLLGKANHFCDGLSRRELLRIGGLAPLGLTLPQLLSARQAAGAESGGKGFGQAKRCLMLFMWGGPAHQDTFDMKPEAPAEMRGEFNPASTNVPGIQICEHMPHLAGQMDKIALVRSVAHTDVRHSTSAHWMLTGHKHRLSAENFGASSTDEPHIGSILSKLSPVASSLPTFVALPERIATTAGAVVPGQFGGKLGKKYDPFTIDQHPDLPDFKIASLTLPDGMNTPRMHQRLELLQTMNAVRPDLRGEIQVQAMQSFYERATDLVTSSAARKAFDLSAESKQQHDRYGRQTFGQGLLLSRRLLEAGVKLVTVYWHRDKPGVDTTWDTHGKNFSGLKDRLIPQVDQPIATLLDDLQQRGLLDETLVVWNSEFGRTPKINRNAGRDHWGRCNTVWFAGAGISGGQVYGASDRIASEPATDPVGPEDISATIFHALGIRPDTATPDRQGRPHFVSKGTALRALY